MYTDIATLPDQKSPTTLKPEKNTPTSTFNFLMIYK